MSRWLRPQQFGSASSSPRLLSLLDAVAPVPPRGSPRRPPYPQLNCLDRTEREGLSGKLSRGKRSVAVMKRNVWIMIGMLGVSTCLLYLMISVLNSEVSALEVEAAKLESGPLQVDFGLTEVRNRSSLGAVPFSMYYASAGCCFRCERLEMVLLATAVKVMCLSRCTMQVPDVVLGVSAWRWCYWQQP
ncbi:uncharacterized protein [Triticum aestivum]|uniref:uncharacterized protein n=1 Tax=Triticum aestivum TaxID=4565 RepID=UPI001D023D70|nr:uncharacterized protein LOC123058111 [Triticum aestivum]